VVVNISGHRAYQKDNKTGEWFSKLEYPGAKGNSPKLFHRLVALFEAWFDAHPEVEIAISGMATGADLCFAQAALNKGVLVHAYVPYKGHGSWKSIYGEIHRYVLEHAAYVYAPDVEYSVSALLQRNKDMVDASDLVLALWDGIEGKGGGTAACVKYAKSVNKPVTNLWKSWIKYRELGSDDEDAGLYDGWV
jgi:hypothetical protein